MPTYEYACTSCGHRFEAVQAFSDPALTTCPNCGGTLRKVFGNVGIVLKGSGFYKTDSRSSRSNGSRGPKESKEKESSTESTPASSGATSESGGSTKEAAASSASGGSEKAGASSS